MSLTNFGEAAALDAAGVLGGTKYMALFTAAPGETGGGTEVTGGAYARVAITFGAASQGAPSTKSNSAAINFAAASADWGNVTHWAVMDAASAGNMIWYGTLTVARNILNGDTASWAIGALICQMD